MFQCKEDGTSDNFNNILADYGVSNVLDISFQFLSFHLKLFIGS